MRPKLTRKVNGAVFGTFLSQLRQQYLGALALFMVLGGTSYAAATNSIGSREIKNNSVRGTDIRNNEVSSGDVRNGSLLAADFKAGQLPAGRRGVPGSAGPKGDAGATGPVGPKGDTGATGAAAPGAVCEGNGPGDVMVRVGSSCIDRYEASVWSSPTGGTQYGVSSDDYPCADNGQDCKSKIFARSVAGVTPSRYITWFQSQQALANSAKRLPSNAEWQTAVAGTLDSVVCNGYGDLVASTGVKAGCVSAWGANDMVGNLAEWVADWDEEADNCANWPTQGFGGDQTCFGADGTPSRFPGALRRGGAYYGPFGEEAGPFAVSAGSRPSDSGSGYGFRGAR